MTSLNPVSVGQSVIKSNKGTIGAVQYGLYSSDEIRAMSVVHVKDTTVVKGGVVQSGGVNDSRLGTTTQSMLCSTCNGTMDNCPGHFGHIELHAPVFNIEFIKYTLKILSCVCYFCSNPLFPPDHPQYNSVMSIRNYQLRLGEMLQRCRKIPSCLKCNGIQPKYVRNGPSISAQFNVNEMNLEEVRHIPKFTPKWCFQILDHIEDDVQKLMGLSPPFSRASSLMWTNFIVPPTTMRPCRIQPSGTGQKISGEDDLTIRLRGIVKINNDLKKLAGGCVSLTTYSYKNKLYTDLKDIESSLGDNYNVECTAKRDPTNAKNNEERLIECYTELQRQIAMYQDGKSCGRSKKDYGQNRKSLRDRMSGPKAKKGRIRYTINGKRQNFSARTVITPCNDIELDEVGVPKWICMKLTIPVRVQSYNVHHLTKLVRNGPDRYPGAVFIENDDGTIHISKTVSNTVQLKFGWVIRRHIVDGDFVLFNRQPSLHKMSIMAHRVKVMDGNSFRLNLSSTSPYNADFDGDEMNIQVLQGLESRAEALTFLGVKYNLVKDGVPIVCLHQHSRAGVYLMTRTINPPSFTQEDISTLIASCKPSTIRRATGRLSSLRAGDGLLTGYDIISFCLPDDMHVPHHRVDDLGNYVEVNSGILTGTVPIDAKILNHVILYVIWKDYGMDAAKSFIGDIQSISEKFLSIEGLTLSSRHCETLLQPELSRKISNAISYINKFKDHSPMNVRDRSGRDLEDLICKTVDRIRDMVGKNVESSVKNAPYNGLHAIIGSGAKGNPTNIIQIAGMIGQQWSHASTRMARVTSHYKDSRTCRVMGRGFVKSSFWSGLSSGEYYMHLIASRSGLVDTAVQTSDTGYSQRRVSKAMEDITVLYDTSARTSDNKIVQFIYGTDGFDADKVESNAIRISSMSDRDILMKYRCHPDPDDQRMNDCTKQRWRSVLQSGEYRGVWINEIRDLIGHKNKLVAAGCGIMSYEKCYFAVNIRRLLSKAKCLPRTSSTTDVTPLDVRRIVVAFHKRVVRNGTFITTPTADALYWDCCSTASLWGDGRLSRNAIVWFFKQLSSQLMACRITPHESVGSIASQYSSAPWTQLTLNRFHKSGLFSALVSGVARMKEIANAVRYPKAPSCKFQILEEFDAERVGYNITEIHASDIISHWTYKSVHNDHNRWLDFTTYWKSAPGISANQRFAHLTWFLDPVKCREYRISPRCLCDAFRTSILRKKCNDFDMLWSYSPLDVHKNMWVCLSVPMEHVLWRSMSTSRRGLSHSPDTSSSIVFNKVAMLINERIVSDCIVRGIVGIKEFYVSTTPRYTRDDIAAPLKKYDAPTVITRGSNLNALSLEPGINVNTLQSNHIREVERFFGIDAASQTIEREWCDVLAINGANVGSRHVQLMASVMCFRGFVCPMTYQGICRDDEPVMKKASYEKSIDAFIDGAFSGKHDVVKGSIDSICWNTRINAGTGGVKLFSEDDSAGVPGYIQSKNNAVIKRRDLVPLDISNNYIERVLKLNTGDKEVVNPYSSYDANNDRPPVPKGKHVTARRNQKLGPKRSIKRSLRRELTAPRRASIGELRGHRGDTNVCRTPKKGSVDTDRPTKRKFGKVFIPVSPLPPINRTNNKTYNSASTDQPIKRKFGKIFRPTSPPPRVNCTTSQTNYDTLIDQPVKRKFGKVFVPFSPPTKRPRRVHA